MFRPIALGAFFLGIAAVVLRTPAPPAPRVLLASSGMTNVFAGALPRPDHTVVVVMENHSYSEIVGSPDAPYINSLRPTAANFTNSHAITHPSEPNYLALFAGTTEDLSDDSCPHTYSGPNLASELAAVGRSFVGYSESMPADGYTGCESGLYMRKHSPWVNFTSVLPAANLTFAVFPTDFNRLPAVAWVTPISFYVMHDCCVGTGDNWLRCNMDSYIRWARSRHNSLFVLTFDEGDTTTNQIPTIFVGSMVIPGDKAILIDHYSVLRTLEDLYGLPPTGNAASASSIAGAFPTATPTPPRMRVSPLRHTPRAVVLPFRTELG